MYAVQNAYERLRVNNRLTPEICSEIWKEASEGDQVQTFQLSSLATQIVLAERNESETDLINKIFSSQPEIGALLTTCLSERLNGTSAQQGPVDDLYARVLINTYLQQTVGRADFNAVIDQLVNDKLNLNFLASWLMLICHKPLKEDDLNHFILALRDSGPIYDYRDSAELNNAKTLRRYPTGALSEKISLIMPSIMSAIAQDYNIVSPFLVGRALSFTGGTWDKFKAIPGFEFPLPGDDSIRAMKECSIAMTVTKGDYNPADRKLYQFRSLTGTVPSHDLIVASIASKMLACPADHLLMDVRYGAGAFLPDLESANKLGKALVKVLGDNNCPCSYIPVSTDWPNGRAIGHCFEVMEAVAIMSRNPGDIWDPNIMQVQEDLTLKFFSGLMNSQFPDKSLEEWTEVGRKLFDSGLVMESFLRLLKAHRVEDSVIEGIRNDPWQTLAPKTTPIIVKAPNGGHIKGVDQKKLGNLVNFKFGAGANEFGGSFTAKSGIILQKLLGDNVESGEVLAKLFINEQFVDKFDESSIIEEFLSCFEI